METLADFLGVTNSSATSSNERPGPRLEDISDPHEFARALLNSYEFRCYMVSMLVLGTIPPAILIRVMDLAGWQKPPERIEHTGKDGDPIITEVRRVIVRTREDNYSEQEDDVAPKYPTH